MSGPIGYLLTWNCYGTWLPGDPRGCVDIRHNAPGGDFAAPNAWRERCNAVRLRHAPVVLDPGHRQIVSQAISDHCAIRGWELHTANVRTNHVHVVLSCGDYAPDVAMDQFKSWATRRLRAAGHFAKPMIVWAEDGSRRYLWSTDSLRRAIEYVADRQCVSGDGAVTGA